MVAHDSGSLIFFLKEKFQSSFQRIGQFKVDLGNFYLSNFFITELRKSFTERERRNLIKESNPNKVSTYCSDSQSFICQKTLSKIPFSSDASNTFVFRQKNLLSNINFSHFSTGLHTTSSGSSPTKASSSYSKPILQEGILHILDDNSTNEDQDGKFVKNRQERFDAEQIAIERQSHICEFKQKPKEAKSVHDSKKQNLIKDSDSFEKHEAEKQVHHHEEDHSIALTKTFNFIISKEEGSPFVLFDQESEIQECDQVIKHLNDEIPSRLYFDGDSSVANQR